MPNPLSPLPFRSLRLGMSQLMSLSSSASESIGDVSEPLSLPSCPLWMKRHEVPYGHCPYSEKLRHVRLRGGGAEAEGGGARARERARRGNTNGGSGAARGGFDPRRGRLQRRGWRLAAAHLVVAVGELALVAWPEGGDFCGGARRLWRELCSEGARARHVSARITSRDHRAGRDGQLGRGGAGAPNLHTPSCNQLRHSSVLYLSSPSGNWLRTSEDAGAMMHGPSSSDITGGPALLPPRA